MYSLAKFKYTVEDTPDKIEKLLYHKNIIIKKFSRAEFWSNYDMGPKEYWPYAKTSNPIVVYIEGTLKVRHSRRFREANSIWKITANDVLAIVK